MNVGCVAMDKKKYSVPKRAKSMETINNAYKLPSTEKEIQYLHAAAGFPMKETWLCAITAQGIIQQGL